MITPLSIVQASATRESNGSFALFTHAQGDFVAGIELFHEKRDLDELNVCETLHAAGLPVPEAGLVYVREGQRNM